MRITAAVALFREEIYSWSSLLLPVQLSVNNDLVVSCLNSR